VELELLKRGWHVEGLDGSARAINGDLIAIKKRARVVLQVKSALSWARPSFGYAGPYLESGQPRSRNFPVSLPADDTRLADKRDAWHRLSLLQRR